MRGVGGAHLHLKILGLGTFSNVFYMISPTQAVVQDISPGLITVGPMLAQSGSPFTNASLAGNYCFKLGWSAIGRDNVDSVPGRPGGPICIVECDEQQH